MISLFFRQLAAMLNAGVPVSQALTSLASSTPRGSFKGCLKRLAESTGRGTSLSVAMADFPALFPADQRAVIAAGETSGTLVLCTSRLSEHLEREQALRNEVKRELLSSRLTMLVALIFWPVVWERLRDSPLLLVIFGIVPLMCFAGLLLLGGLISRLSGHFPLWLDRTIARTPILGPMAWAIAQAKFLRSLASLYQSGLSLPESVQLACDGSGNLAFSERVRPTIPKMQRGSAISEALAATHALDDFALSLLKIGEHTGDFGGTLEKAAEHFEQGVSLALHKTKVNLGIAAVLNVGLCVGLILYSNYV